MAVRSKRSLKSAAAWLLGSRFRNSLTVWIFLFQVCCVLGRCHLCGGMISCSEGPNVCVCARLCVCVCVCLIVCDLTTSTIRRLRPHLGYRTRKKDKIHKTNLGDCCEFGGFHAMHIRNTKYIYRFCWKLIWW